MYNSCTSFYNKCPFQAVVDAQLARDGTAETGNNKSKGLKCWPTTEYTQLESMKFGFSLNRFR